MGCHYGGERAEQRTCLQTLLCVAKQCRAFGETLLETLEQRRSKGTLLLYTGPPRFLLPLGRNPKAELMMCYLLSLTTLPRSGSGPPCLAGDRLRIRLPRLRWRSQRMETPLPPKSRSSRSANQSRHVAELLRCRVWQRQLMAGGLGTVPSGWRLATSGQGPVDGMADGKCRHREAAWVHAAWQL